ncbi:MAG: PQQ-dependent sugar dehydrogenase, partial [Actinomycetota bacterium]
GGAMTSRLLPVALVMAAVLSGCVAGDQETATLGAADPDSQTLPSVTEAPADTGDAEDTASDDDSDGASSGTDTASDDADDDTTTSTATTEPLDPLQGLDAELVVDGFDQPVLVTGAPGTDVLYVVERKGVIRVVVDGQIADEPFLDLTDQLLSSSIEQGLLGLAFHPDHETNRTFYAYWTDPAGDSRLARFQAESPTVADPESIEVVLEVDQPAERHNAGMLQFGPDGLLYVSLGDGGSGGATSQDTSNLLGSILRLDVDRPDEDAGLGYSIPAGNPFDDEIWVYGLRNPWRFSIDDASETVYIGDVGQEQWEEINVVGLDGAGTNFGWFETEGSDCFRPGCDQAGLTDPVLQYSHDEGCSVTGGVVYHGSD